MPALGHPVTIPCALHFEKLFKQMLKSELWSVLSNKVFFPDAPITPKSSTSSKEQTPGELLHLKELEIDMQLL